MRKNTKTVINNICVPNISTSL